MILEPEVDVECDYCGNLFGFSLTKHFGRRCWGMRGLEKELRLKGWTNDPKGSDYWYCPNCAKERKGRP